jgi:hypothetical protein
MWQVGKLPDEALRFVDQARMDRGWSPRVIDGVLTEEGLWDGEGRNTVLIAPQLPGVLHEGVRQVDLLQRIAREPGTLAMVDRMLTPDELARTALGIGEVAYARVFTGIRASDTPIPPAFFLGTMNARSGQCAEAVYPLHGFRQTPRR